MIVCGFRTGLRTGELIGLKWESINFYDKVIYVQHNVTRGKLTTPKSKASRRFVRMSNELIKSLEKQRLQVKEWKLKHGWKDMSEWVFPNEEGGFVNYDSFLKQIWHRAIEKAGMAGKTPYDMRHTYATLRLSAGHLIAEVSKEMGHSSMQITYSTYYKWMPQETRSNIDELDSARPLFMNAGSK